MVFFPVKSYVVIESGSRSLLGRADNRTATEPIQFSRSRTDGSSPTSRNPRHQSAAVDSAGSVSQWRICREELQWRRPFRPTNANPSGFLRSRHARGRVREDRRQKRRRNHGAVRLGRLAPVRRTRRQIVVVIRVNPIEGGKCRSNW